MKFLKFLGILIVILIIAVVVLGLIAPKDYKVERSQNINAPKELVFSHVKYWNNWQAWSPWGEKDKTMKVTVSGTDGEKGSVYKWTGDPKNTGKGEMKNTGVIEDAEIKYHLHFLEPWDSESEGYVKVTGTGNQCKVAWGFHGKSPFPMNIMNLFMSMEKMVGPDFSKGLKLLKAICEKEAEPLLKYNVQQVDFTEKTYAFIRKEVEFTGIKEFFETSFSTITEAMKKNKLEFAGAPCGLYYVWDDENQKSDMAAAVPIKGELKSFDIGTITLPQSTAYSVDYFGPYEQSEMAHNALNLYLKIKKMEYKPPIIEEYITDPSQEPDPEKWHTKLYYFGQ